MNFNGLKPDRITGLPVTAATPLDTAGPQPTVPSGAREPVYAMVGLVANGLTASDDRCITPGGALPQVPALSPETEVYQFVAAISQGVGYGPGNAFVPVPSQPTAI